RLASDFFKDCFVNPNPGIEILEREVFIWRMGAAIRKREPEQERFDAENLSKIGNNRDATSLSNEHGITIESMFERALRGFAVFGIGIGEIPWARMTGSYIETYSRWTIFLKMFLRQRSNFVAVLIRNEPESQLGECFATNHRLGASTLVSPAQPVDFRRRARPNSLKSGKAFFAE